MTNANWDEEAIAKGLNRLNNADYVKKYIKEPLGEMMNSLSEGLSHCSSDLGPIDLSLLLIFTNIDFLGYLYKGEGNSIYAVKFMREYFGKVDDRYARVSGLLYDALRHGYVHLATPKRIQLKNGMILDFSFAFAGHKRSHLKITKREEIEREGRVEIYRLFVDVNSLYQDLLSAIDMYAEDIRHNQALSDVFWKAFEARRKPEKAKEEVLTGKPYIRKSDFDFVREQILRL